MAAALAGGQAWALYNAGAVYGAWGWKWPRPLTLVTKWMWEARGPPGRRRRGCPCTLEPEAPGSSTVCRSRQATETERAPGPPAPRVLPILSSSQDRRSHFHHHNN